MNSPKPHLRSFTIHPKNPRFTNPCLPLSAFSALAAVVFVYLLFSSPSPSPPVQFSIVIDAGSSGTRIHVYRYRSSTQEIDLGSSAEMRVSPGLSSYVGEPERAGESLVELVDFGKRKVPRELWGQTEVRLMATAGMRMLDDGVKEAILESCRMVLRSSGFRFRGEWADVIPGSAEGIYAWVSANYALGTLGGDPDETTGIIELGGASAQVTFVTSELVPAEYSHVIKFGERTYNLYSHSFLHLGQNVAHESLHAMLISRNLKSGAGERGTYADPCSPKQYSHSSGSLKLSAADFSSKKEHHLIAQASGNFSECRSAALMLLRKGKDKCLYEDCVLGSTFVPKLRGSFIATENFFYTSESLGLGSIPFLSNLILAGKQVCEEDWSKLRTHYPNLNGEDFSRYCFSSAYIVALMHDSLGIALDDKRIQVANQVSGIPLDWALGAFIMQGMPNHTSKCPYWIPAIFSDHLSVLLSLLVISLLAVLTVWAISRWRRPQLKTIYDLEKGRYIITRVN